LSGLLKVRRAGRREFEPELIDMNGEIESIIRSMNSQIRSSGAEVNVGELPVCYGDRSQVSQIFTNLLDNALKYLKPNLKGQISITGYCESNFCYYTVEDNGTGIDKSQHEKIFRIFHRAVNDCDVKGEGIGLTIVGEIVERCGGQILVESEPGEGTKFIVVLPAGPIP
jgi:signal transduction histidine kinase